MIVDTNALSAIADAALGIGERMAGAEVVATPWWCWASIDMALPSRAGEPSMSDEANLPACRVLEVTAETAARYAEVRLEMKQAGTPLPANDTWIAALCRQHRLPILSRDQHFDLVKGVQRLTW